MQLNHLVFRTLSALGIAVVFAAGRGITAFPFVEFGAAK
jgi:hypothetical protein